MYVDAIWPEIELYRRSLITVLAELADDDWRQPSLCTGWTVKDVLAHLTYQHIDLRTAAGGMFRARGDIDRMIHDVAVRRATAMSTVELLDRFRGMLGSRRHPPGVTWREAVTDNLVHGQDITVPLGRPPGPRGHRRRRAVLHDALAGDAEGLAVPPEVGAAAVPGLRDRHGMVDRRRPRDHRADRRPGAAHHRPAGRPAGLSCPGAEELRTALTNDRVKNPSA
jgi:uncharacterized protein (TIGR03083 family)